MRSLAVFIGRSPSIGPSIDRSRRRPTRAAASISSTAWRSWRPSPWRAPVRDGRRSADEPRRGRPGIAAPGRSSTAAPAAYRVSDPCAEDLHPTIDDPRLQLRRDELDRRCIHPRFAWAFGVHSRRMKHEQARLVDLQSRMGDPVLNIREVADALPESGRSRARSHTSSSASSHWPTLRMA